MDGLILSVATSTVSHPVPITMEQADCLPGATDLAWELLGLQGCQRGHLSR